MLAIIEWYIHDSCSGESGDIDFYDKCVLKIPERNIVVEYDDWLDNPQNPYSYIYGFNDALGIKLDVQEFEFKSGAVVCEIVSDIYN